MNKSKSLIIFNFFVLITFNINFSHFCFHNININLGIVPSGIILTVIMIFSYLFQCSFVSFLIESKAFNFGKLIETHFGSLSALIYEIIALLWLCLSFLSTFITSDTYLSFVIGDNINNSYYQYAISTGFFIVLLVINSCKSAIFINCSIVISFMMHFLCFGLFIYSLSIRSISIELNTFVNVSGKASYYFEAFSALSSIMNTIIILFWVNIKLKKDFNYSTKQLKIVLIINYLFNFIFYATYIIEGLFKYNIAIPLENSNSDNDNRTLPEHYLLFLLKENRDNVSLLICNLFISINIAYEIFLTTFYFFVLKTMIFRTITREFFSGRKYYFYFTPLLLIVLVLSLALNDPYRIILINNSTFGFLVNFIFPCKYILNYMIF